MSVLGNNLGIPAGIYKLIPAIPPPKGAPALG